MIKYPRYTYPQRDCLTQTTHRLLMVRLPHSLTLSTSEGRLSFKASYVHAVTGQEINEVTINLRGPATVYFAPSHKYAGWYYIMQYSQRAKKHICTCSENRRSDWCAHVDDLPATAINGIA